MSMASWSLSPGVGSQVSTYRVNGLHNIPPLLPPGDHARVQNSWHLLEYKLFKAIPTL